MKVATPSLIALLCLTCSTSTLAECLDTGVQLQILGSGGPGASGGRASSGYLLWVDGVSRIMVDAGSGTKDQFYRAGANSDDIEFVGLSHLHPDHSAELPAIFWPAGGSFNISGPTGSDDFPSIEKFLELLMGQNGAYSVLAPRMNLQVTTVDTSSRQSMEIWSADNILASATAVPHGEVPTLAYKFEFAQTSIVFASDQNGSDPVFIDFAKGVDYLVIHLTGTEDATGVIAQLHAKPSVWGDMAASAEVGQVIVSHISATTTEMLDESLAIIRLHYAGPLVIGEDLMCIEL